MTRRGWTLRVVPIPGMTDLRQPSVTSPIWKLCSKRHTSASTLSWCLRTCVISTRRLVNCYRGAIELSSGRRHCVARQHYCTGQHSHPEGLEDGREDHWACTSIYHRRSLGPGTRTKPTPSSRTATTLGTSCPPPPAVRSSVPWQRNQDRRVEGQSLTSRSRAPTELFICCFYFNCCIYYATIITALHLVTLSHF